MLRSSPRPSAPGKHGSMNRLLRVGGAFTSVILFLAVMVPPVAAQTSMLVVPNEVATVEGNSANAWPFNIGAASFRAQRYHQVYGASDFASLSGPQRITQIAFRPDSEAGAAFAATIPSIEIRLSTTTKAPDGLSAVFADNVGANDTVVYAGALSLSSSFDGPPEGPKAFDIVINLQTPFNYDPAAGNLLLDVRVFSGTLTTFLDAHTTPDAVSRTYSISGDINDPLGIPDTVGLVTRFTLESVANTPGTKEDCKNGGWRTLTRADGSPFKNAGDCIQYVNTGK